jgi:hypothetical protein
MSSTLYTVGVRIVGSAASMVRAAKEALAQTRMLGTGATQEFNKMARARALLGVRPEREIQREIQRTEAAYNRLARTSTMSFNEQRRAAAAMREEVMRLTNEMGRMTTRQKLAQGFRGTAALGGAAVAIGSVLKPKLDRAMSYDTRLRHVTNTKLDVDAPQAQRDMDRARTAKTVYEAVKYGGGNQDDALETYAQMVSKGSAFKGDMADRLLPEILKAATATDSAAADIARIAAAGLQVGGMKPNEVKEWFNIAAMGGKLGGFELKNQAQYLPEQLALSGQIGMTGKADFANLVMLNQAAEKTAGTPDKAAVNVKQFMTDIGSQHFRHRVEKTTGLNFTKFAVDNRLNHGVGMIDSAMELIDRQLQKSPAYKQVQKQLSDAKTPEQRLQALESADRMIQGSVASKFFHNQESTQVVAAYMANKQFIKDGQKQALGGADLIDANYRNIAAGPGYQANQLAIESAQAMQSSMEKLTPVYGELSSKMAELMHEYPGLTSATVLATGALGSLATMAGALALAGFKLPGGPAPSVPPGPGGPGAGAAGRSSRWGALGKLSAIGSAAWLLKDIFYTSPEEIAILKKAEDARNEAKRASQARTLEQRLGNNGTTTLPPQQDLKGEIVVRITGAPGLSVQAETKTNSPRIPFRTDLGQTNLAAGF